MKRHSCPPPSPASLAFLRSGSVRDLYAVDKDLLIVSSDHVAVNGVTFPTPIPDKGRLLTALSTWWFNRMAPEVSHHLISAVDSPYEFAGRAIRCRRLEMIPVELVVRGYVAGAGLDEYQANGTIGGIRMPRGLVKGSRLTRPVFCPEWKGSPGQRDVPTCFSDLADRFGVGLARRLQDVAMRVYHHGTAVLQRRGLILADTKVEVGLTSDGRLTLADEVLTCDSSRIWPTGVWALGKIYSLDRQFIRDWAAGTGWHSALPAPEIPPDLVHAARNRYVMAYERITGLRWRVAAVDTSSSR